MPGAAARQRHQPPGQAGGAVYAVGGVFLHQQKLQVARANKKPCRPRRTRSTANSRRSSIHIAPRTLTGTLSASRDQLKGCLNTGIMILQLTRLVKQPERRSQVHREETKDAKILHISHVLR